MAAITIKDVDNYYEQFNPYQRWEDENFDPDIESCSDCDMPEEGNSDEDALMVEDPSHIEACSTCGKYYSGD